MVWCFGRGSSIRLRGEREKGAFPVGTEREKKKRKRQEKEEEDRVVRNVDEEELVLI